MKRIVLITGTPGVGKTSVSQRLDEKLNAIHVDIGQLVKQENLVAGEDKERRTLIADDEKLSRRIADIIREKHAESEIIFDGHYAGNIVPRRYVKKVFVLRRHPKELKKMMEKRGFGNRKLWENMAAEILDVPLYDAIEGCGMNKVCEIDTTGKSVDDVVAGIISILEGKKPCEQRIVDWLGELEKENLLDEFLKDF